MSKEEECLEAILHVAEIQARQILLELHMPSLVPIWVMVGGDGKVDILPTPWYNEEEKHGYANMVRILMRRRKVVAYSFLTEAWTARLAEDEVGLIARKSCLPAPVRLRCLVGNNGELSVKRPPNGLLNWKSNGRRPARRQKAG
jgi:hypothetical protein